jgi:hypothetical protein
MVGHCTVRPTHRAIRKYYETVAALRDQHVFDEMNVRSAFETLLNQFVSYRLPAIDDFVASPQAQRLPITDWLVHFSDTITFPLTKGPLRTEELHPLIQLLHPDLCDDSVDRVIDGVHFGQKWTHYVPNAQQYLKRNGEIEFDGSRWNMAQGAEGPSSTTAFVAYFDKRPSLISQAPKGRFNPAQANGLG